MDSTSHEHETPARAGLESESGTPGTVGATELARRREVTTEVALLFVVLAILALALVPFLDRERVGELEMEIQEVLEPGQHLVSEYTFAQVRGMAQIQSFLLSDDALQRSRQRQRYEELRSQGDSLFDELSRVLAPLGVDDLLINLDNASTNWHLSYTEVLSGNLPRETFEPSGQVLLYEGMLGAATALQDDLFERIEPARARIEAARGRQLVIAWVLMLMALLAALVVSYIARRLRSLTQESEAQFRAAVTARREADRVLAGTADGVLGVDLEGRCVFLNRAGADLLGRPPSDVLGKDVHEMVLHSRADGEPYPREASPLTRALESADMSFTSDEVFWRRDGSSFPVRLSGRPMVDGREVRGAVLSFVDLTEIREVESKLRQAVRARDEVVSIVSHDLRNPVGTVYIAADLLLDIPLPREKQQEQLGVIKRQAKLMEHLIKDLLDVSRIEAGTFPVTPSRVDLGPLVHEAAENLLPATKKRGISLQMHVPGAVPAVRADRTRILQVLWNLMGNAVKYTPDGGEVTVHVTAAGEIVRVAVADSGAGIAADDLPFVFDRFWQVKRQDREGAGLGLAIVKGIVEAHGGTVGVRSRPGEGSTFSFTVPVWTPDDEEGEAPVVPAPTRRGFEAANS